MAQKIVIRRDQNGWRADTGEYFPGIKGGSVLRFLRTRYPDAQLGAVAIDVGPAIAACCWPETILWMKPGCPK